MSRPGGANVAATGGRAPRRTVGRALALPLGMALCLVFGGCIYVRLLELRDQLAHFDRYFSVDPRRGLTIVCRDPVLLDRDLAFFRLAPASRTRIGVAERWHFRWVKNPAPTGEPPSAHDISADFIFVDHRLTRVILPPRLFVFVPKPFFLQMIRAFGHARIDRTARTASAQVRTTYAPGRAPARLSRAELTSLLGAPTTVARGAAGLRWRYRYRSASPGQRSGFIDVTFTIDPATGIVRHIQGVLFNGRIDLDFPDAPRLPAPDAGDRQATRRSPLQVSHGLRPSPWIGGWPPERNLRVGPS